MYTFKLVSFVTDITVDDQKLGKTNVSAVNQSIFIFYYSLRPSRGPSFDQHHHYFLPKVEDLGSGVYSFSAEESGNE